MRASTPSDPAAEKRLPIAAGQILGERYRVGEVLGNGGMGVVFSGTHLLLGTPVAIKLIHSELKDEHEAVQRFLNEARASAALKGEHIARVFDVGILDTGEPYLVMEHLEGIGLDQYLRERGPCTETEAVDLVLQVCEGLTEAHAAGLVHRDIKPANLFLARRADGQFSLKILDFGIAKRRASRFERNPGLTDPGKSLGSPWYMSPEQMMTPHTVDQRADVWSVGVLLFELLTDQLPFGGESVPQVCANVLSSQPPRVGELRHELAPELDAIVMRCLEKDPADRFHGVDELARALLPFASPPSYRSGLSLDAPVFPLVDRDARDSALSYGSLRPLGTDSYRPSTPRSGWPSALGVLLLALGVAGACVHFQDPTIFPRTVHSAQSRPVELDAHRFGLPWDPELLPAPAAAELNRPIPSSPLPKTTRLPRAVPEVERLVSGAVAAPLSETDAHARALNYEAWLRSQGLTRLPTDL